ncbi:N2227-domain-containing protein [Macrolepiota fuliginosa MF-IS2]|uniref:carnosine N-methyltransferase n=1 Tax=Macrolepiota fuliginosa MF-IS2 TaxID=1400762 RepID=A0A9P5X9A0_9AGAR|nr:N2227-domain-containing protein [Macrolepiota fuliginosa MF-IS2]
MTFRSYARYAISANNRRRKDIFRLPRADIELIRGLRYREKLENVDRAILENAHFLLRIVENPEMFGHDVDYEQYDNDEVEQGDRGKGKNQDGSAHTHEHGHGHDHAAGPSHSHPHSQPHGHSHPRSHGPNRQKEFRPSESDMDKLRSTLKQFVRDWSVEGKSERDACYEPIKQALLEYFKEVQPENRSRTRVLVPGVGLGRLAFDVAQLGFACQGNEFSHYMLLGSYFMLNQTTEINQHRIYPYIHTFSNASSRQDILRPILIPDVLPSSLPAGLPFSLVAGDFEEVYGGESDPEEPQHGLWDAVLTCFFIDTAKNIVNYLRIIHKILAPGGVWINLGPLLWHWENNTSGDMSIELDLEEVKELARAIGFEISVRNFLFWGLWLLI